MSFKGRGGKLSRKGCVADGRDLNTAAAAPISR